MKYQKKNLEKRKFKNNYKSSDEQHTQEEWDGGEFSEDPNETRLPKWHEEFVNTPAPIQQLTDEEITALRNEASHVLTDETAYYHSNKEKRKHGSDQAWIKTVLQKGTASDKVAAHVLKIQESPVYNLSSITTLVNMVKLSKTDFSFVVDSLAELFITDLLPPDLKLRTFEKQPLDQLSDLSSGNAMTRRKRLAYWAFEDELKKLYMQLIQSLNIITRDSVEANKEKAVSVLYQLLSSHPEQEDVILKILVNKLGDPSRKVASKAIYSLTQLLRVHEAMKQVVMNEVEHLLFRPNINTKAQYYAICFLSQFTFTINDDQVACNIMSIYFSFFKACIKKGDVSSRMLGSLLQGLNRAYPYAKKNSDALTDHENTLYKLANLATFNISIQCLSILFQVSQSSEDRFYNVLYRKLSDFQLGTSAHQAMFINLLYRALMKDSSAGRIKTFIKRILQLCGVMPVPLACGLLYLVSQMICKRKLKIKKILQPEAIDEKFAEDDDDEEYYKDVDTGEVSSAEKHKNLDNSEIKQEESEDDFIKQEVDSVIDESDVKEIRQENKNVEDNKERKPCAAWYHTVFQKKRKTGFDPLARNPSFSLGESAIYTELTLLTRHFHPTVALFASQILNDKVIQYTGDPLIDFSLIRFIERFVFKNPKTVAFGTEVKGPDPVLARRKYYTPTGPKALATNSKLYLEQNEKDVPIDEFFLFKYLRQKQSLGYRVARKEKDDNDSDVDSVASEEFEEVLNNMVSKKEDIDFADDIGDSLTNRSKKFKQKNKDEEDDDDDDDDFDDGDEDEGDFDNEDGDEFGDEKIKDELGSDNDESDLDLSDIDDSDAEVMDFDESEDEVDDVLSKNKSKHNKKGSKNDVRKLKEDLSELFVPAEEFAEMLEETGTSGYKTGTAHALSNKDKAATKQLDWEMKRHDWVKGHNKRKNNNNFKKGKRRKMK